MRILIDDKEIDNRAYIMPWYNDGTCFNFKSPDTQIDPEKVNNIDCPLSVKTLVIECDLKDYSFIRQMKNLTQLYIYTGTNITDLSFLEGLEKLKQLCILNSHIASLESLKKLIDRKYEIYEGISKDEIMEGLKYRFEGICIQSDAYDSDGTELVKLGICVDNIRINEHLISYAYSLRKRREEMAKKLEKGLR